MSFDRERFMEHGLTVGEKHLRRLAVAVERGEVPPLETLQFLAQAGRKILEGASPQGALELNKPKGNKKADGWRVWRRIDIVRCICMLMDDHGFTLDAAISRIAIAMRGTPGYSPKSLERFYLAYHELARDTNRANRAFADFMARQLDFLQI